MSARTTTTGLAAVAAAAVLAGLTPGVAAAASEGPQATYLVTSASAGVHDDLLDDLALAGGPEVVRELDGVGMAVVEATAAEASALASDPRVAGLTVDGAVALQSTASYDAAADTGSMYNINDTIGAPTLWKDRAGRLRWTGKSVDVAVLDSGVSPVAGLSAAGKIVNGPDLSLDAGSATTRYVDGFGHGTHMAGIIAGRDAGADPGKSDPTAFLGVAPDARIVNVKVADALGNADVSQIIAGIDWVVQNRTTDGMNIRVLNLSLGTPSRQSSLLDPLAHAAEQAWHRGIVVVVAAGNDGTGTGKLLNPAQNPYVIAVGANDSKGTKSTDDDVIPEFSTRGDGRRNPDLVASGASVQSLRAPGSTIDREVGPQAGIDDRFLRGSGTSQAAAVVSGAAALLLDKQPDLTPDQVKARLVANARRLPAADAQAQGAGMVDLRPIAADLRPIGAVVSGPQTHARSTGTGSLDAARGGYRPVASDGTVLRGELDLHGMPFSSTAHAALASTGTAWTGGWWNGSQWTGDGMTATGWAAAPVVSATASDLTGRTWAGRTWAGRTWAGRTWAGGLWAGAVWQ